MSRFVLQPRAGYSMDEARSDPRPKKAKLFVENSEFRKEIPFFEEIQSIFGREVKFDEGMLREEKFRYQGTDVTMWSEWPAQEVSTGLNPYTQLIYRLVKTRGPRTIPEMIDYLVNEENVLKETEQNKKQVRKDVAELVEKRVLQPTSGHGIPEKEMYKLGSRKLRDEYGGWGVQFIYYERGKHLIKNEIYKRLRDTDGMREDQIIEYISSTLMWETPEVTKEYLKTMTEEDVLTKSGDKYETKNPLPPL